MEKKTVQTIKQTPHYFLCNNVKILNSKLNRRLFFNLWNSADPNDIIELKLDGITTTADYINMFFQDIKDGKAEIIMVLNAEDGYADLSDCLVEMYKTKHVYDLPLNKMDYEMIEIKKAESEE
jgi:hypothetical protein